MQAVLDPGDEVILPTPYWVTYTETIKLAGAIPKIVQTHRANGYKITPQQLKESITGKTAMLVINSPNNPGGFTYTPEEFSGLAKVLEGTKVIVLSDEIYEKLIYGDTKFVSFASLSEDAYNRTLTVNGFSKTFAMTGWRLGYTAGPLCPTGKPAYLKKPPGHSKQRFEAASRMGTGQAKQGIPLAWARAITGFTGCTSHTG